MSALGACVRGARWRGRSSGLSGFSRGLARARCKPEHCGDNPACLANRQSAQRQRRRQQGSTDLRSADQPRALSARGSSTAAQRRARQPCRPAARGWFRATSPACATRRAGRCGAVRSAQCAAHQRRPPVGPCRLALAAAGRAVRGARHSSDALPSQPLAHGAAGRLIRPT